MEPKQKPTDELMREWATLKRAVEEKIRIIKATQDSEETIPEEEITAFVDLVGKEMEAKRCLDSRLMHANVHEKIDPQLLASLQEFIRANKKKATKLLGEEDFELEAELEADAWNFLYHLGGAPKILLRYLQTETVVTSTSVPPRIVELIDEARTSHAVGQKHAVFALGRMILEAALTDIGVRTGRFPNPASLEDFYSAYPPSERANRLLGTAGKRRKEFRELYNAGSMAIHPSIQSPGIQSLEYLDRVVCFVSNEYAIQVRV